MSANTDLKYYPLEEIKNYRVLGRTNEDMFPMPLFWNNSGIEVNVDGSELWIDVEVGNDFFEPWIAVELNGAFMSRQMLLEGQYSICLYRSMIKGVKKNVKFYRELQALCDNLNCHLLVKGLRTDGEFLPLEEKKMKIEFLGDSITSGEGTYGAKDDMEWLPMYMSSSRNYATMIGKKLDADIRLISSGGWGFYSGWDNDIRHTIPAIYEKVCGISTGPVNEALGSQKLYDFSLWQPDAVVINLGTNDASAFDQPAFDVPGVGPCKLRRDEDGKLNREDCDKLSYEVSKFIKTVRKNNPNAHILWVYGMLGYELGLTISKGVIDYSNETGDTNVAYMTLMDTTPDSFGSRWHPGIPVHEKAADMISKYLERFIKE